MIDFEATYEKIAAYDDTLVRDWGAEYPTTGIMRSVAFGVMEGTLKSFAEDDQDAFSESFVRWAKARNFLVLK